MSQQNDGAQVAAALDVDEQLRDLEIDGYQVVFTKKIALMPVELTPIREVTPQS